MDSTQGRAILVIGDAQPTETLLSRAAQYAEVFVLARAIPDRNSRFVIDADRAHVAAQGQLARVITQLRGRGTRAHGLIGDADPRAARRDALALFPQAGTLLEAA
jgi:hypothetical protein